MKNLEKNNWSKIKKYIQNKQIDWDCLVDHNNSLLHYLAYHKQTELIKAINEDTLEQIIEQPNIEGDTVCHIAAKLDNTDLINLAIDYQPNIIYIKNKLSYTPIHYLVSNNKLMKQIINTIKPKDHYLNNEYTLLEYYILKQDMLMIKFLLKHIKLNNLSNLAMCTAVESENSTENKLAILKLLLDHGLDINFVNERFIGALNISVQQGEYDVTNFLLKNGANVNYSGPENIDNPLMIAIKNSDVRMIELLLEYNADVNICNKYLQTPLHYLLENKINLPLEIKRKLLQKANNINKMDNKMNSILNLLIHYDGWADYIDILENRKLKIYLKNRKNVSPNDGVNDQKNKFMTMVYQSYINKLDPDILWVDDIDKKISLMLVNGDEIGAYKNYIMRKIISGQSYPIQKKRTMINFINAPETNITHFSSYSYNYICFLHYILQKYPNVKIPSMPPEMKKYKSVNDLYKEMIVDYKDDNSPDHNIFRLLIRDYINHSPVLINHLIIWKNGSLYFFSPYIAQGIHETIIKYPDTKFILFKLTIVSDNNFNHANMIIYDIENNYFERFDPYGYVKFYDSDLINELLESFVKDYFPDAKYLSPKETCQESISYQIFSDEKNISNFIENDPNGFCVAWCLWYVEMRIKNHEITPKSLINRTVQLINQNQDKFKDHIRNYSNYIDSEKNSILARASIPKKYWYSTNIPYDYYQKYIRYIRQLYRNIT